MQVVLYLAAKSRRARRQAPTVVFDGAAGDEESEGRAVGLGGCEGIEEGRESLGLDPLAVVDHRLKVHGIDGLRVADASIMPKIVGGNTNAPSIMIGEKASDLIIADQ